MSRRKPAVDMACCTMCDGCLEALPQVFLLNQAGGYVEVAELDRYPEEAVQEAINNCPRECISWEEES